MFVCLFWIRNRICPTGSTPDAGPTESSPTTQATRHPRAYTGGGFLSGCSLGYVIIPWDMLVSQATTRWEHQTGLQALHPSGLHFLGMVVGLKGDWSIGNFTLVIEWGQKSLQWFERGVNQDVANRPSSTSWFPILAPCWQGRIKARGNPVLERIPGPLALAPRLPFRLDYLSVVWEVIYGVPILAGSMVQFKLAPRVSSWQNPRADHSNEVLLLAGSRLQCKLAPRPSSWPNFRGL